MGTEILRPQDCLVEKIRVPPAAFSRRRNYGTTNFNNSHASNYQRTSRKPVTRPERKRHVSEPSVSKRSSSDDSRIPKTGPVMEKVTILRRGESLDSKVKSENLKKEGDCLVVCGTERLGPDPEMVSEQIRFSDVKSGIPFPQFSSKTDVYAGSAFAVSPSPSSLPLPSFSKKKIASASVDDSATRDLRRLLRLE